MMIIIMMIIILASVLKTQTHYKIMLLYNAIPSHGLVESGIKFALNLQLKHQGFQLSRCRKLNAPLHDILRKHINNTSILFQDPQYIRFMNSHRHDSFPGSKAEYTGTLDLNI